MFWALQRRGVVGKLAVDELPVILVVEDEYALQGIVEDALTLFKGGLKNYKALVADVNLKGRLNGWEVARRIREIEPACPVVYMTGAAGDEWASHGVPNSILLEKPFAPAQLVTAVSQLINSVPPT